MILCQSQRKWVFYRASLQLKLACKLCTLNAGTGRKEDPGSGDDVLE